MNIMIHPEELVPTTIVRDKFHKQKRITELMSSKVVVDAGSGTGFFSERFLKKAKTVYALDVSFDNLLCGKNIVTSKSIQFLNADAHELPFQKDSVDVVFFSCTLEHLENPDRFYRELHRILKPGGIIIQSVDIRPRLTYLLYKLTFLFDRLYGAAHPMIHKKTLISDDRCHEFISDKKLKHFIEQTRFQILEEEKYAGLNFNLIQTTLVLMNKCYQLFWGNIVAESNYGQQTKNITKPLFRIYRQYVLPVITKLLHPQIWTFDAIYYYMLLQKRS